MRNKYHAIRTVVGNITFDSRAEAKMYTELQHLLRTGDIVGLKLQPEFELLPRLILPNGKVQRALTYKADFEFYDAKQGRKRVIDCKGFETREYKLKKKLFNAKFISEGLVLEQTI